MNDKDSSELAKTIYNDFKEMSYALKNSEEFKDYIKRYQKRVQFIDILIWVVGVLFLVQIFLFSRHVTDVLGDLTKITIPVTGTFLGVLIGKRLK